MALNEYDEQDVDYGNSSDEDIWRRDTLLSSRPLDCTQ